MVWAVDFHREQDIASSQDFVKAYKAEYNEDPLNYAGRGYDAAWFLARSIKEAGSADRAEIRTGWPPSRRSLHRRPRQGPGMEGPDDHGRRGCGRVGRDDRKLLYTGKNRHRGIRPAT